MLITWVLPAVTNAIQEVTNAKGLKVVQVLGHICGLMVSGGKEKGHYVQDIFLIIGKKDKKAKMPENTKES